MRRSLAYSIAGSYFALPLQIIGTMVISRLLTPAETGVFAIAAVFAAFASTFRDFGVAEYLIQEKEVTDQVIRAALSVNIFVSWLMGLILFFSAPFAADFYRNNGIADVMHVQAINFILIPFGAVTLANFRRQMNYRPIFIVGVWSGLASFTTAVACAFLGFGYMSLAWSSLAGVVASVGVSVWFRPKDFPRWPGLTGIGRVLKFGKFASGIYIFGQIGRGAPEVIIGRAQDIVGVAMFSRGYGLVELFNRSILNAISSVCLPYFSQNNREYGSAKSGYLKSIKYITVIGWPFLGFMSLMAFAAIRVIYGDQWDAAVPLAQILCMVGAIDLVHFFSKEALIATGEVKRSNTLQIWLQLTRISGLLLVVPFGLIGACYGLLLASIIGVILSQWHLNAALGLSLAAVVKSCMPSAAITFLSIGPLIGWAVLDPISESNYLVNSVVGGLSMCVIWLFLLRFFKHELWSEFIFIFRKIIFGLASKK